MTTVKLTITRPKKDCVWKPGGWRHMEDVHMCERGRLTDVGGIKVGLEKERGGRRRSKKEKKDEGRKKKAEERMGLVIKPH